MPFKNLIVEQRGRAVSVAINRPERMNAFDQATADEFAEVFSAYRDNPEQWVMIITGVGEKAFCAGVDVKDLAVHQNETQKAREYHLWKPAADLMQSIHKPFIAAVNGWCVGGGWHLAADSDIIIASENAVFMDTHVNLGLVNGVESTAMAFKMPPGVVLRMVIEGRHWRVSAQQAHTWGLVTEVVPPAQLMPRAWEIAQHIAEESATLAVQASKKAVLGALSRGLHEGLAYAWTVLPETWGTEDILEGPRAFVEKRKPQFQGR
ncbi:MAG: enoyl-CoA hydratase/isomerase family protein [Dehalococcoidia bacterium]